MLKLYGASYLYVGCSMHSRHVQARPNQPQHESLSVFHMGKGLVTVGEHLCVH